MRSIVVVGASLAGLRAVETLRREGFDGRLTLVGAEPHLPYDRPPLSKELLAGEWEHDQVVLRKVPYEELDLELRLGVAATGLDLGRRVVNARRRDASSRSTGSSSRPGRRLAVLPGQPDARRRVHPAHDRRLLRDPRPPRRRARASASSAPGFIGAEVAATCRKRGLEVTVLEALPQPMVRGVGTELGAVLARLHREHGVDLRCGVTLESIEGDGPGRARPARRRRAHRLRRPARRGRRPCPRRGGSKARGWCSTTACVCDETLLAAPGWSRRGDVARWPNPRVRRRGHAGRALDERGRAGRLRGAAAASRRRHGRARAVRAGAVRLVGPVRREDPGRRPLRGPGPHGGRARLARGGPRSSPIFERGGRISGVLGFSAPRQVMQYRRMVARAGERSRPRSNSRPQPRAERDHSPMPRAARATPDAPVPHGHVRRGALLPLARRAAAGAPAVRGGRARRRHARGSASRSGPSRSARCCCGRTPAGSATGTGGASWSSSARSWSPRRRRCTRSRPTSASSSRPGCSAASGRRRSSWAPGR